MVFEDLLPPQTLAGFAEPISPTGVKEGESVSVLRPVSRSVERPRFYSMGRPVSKILIR
jgi:hypothetical protein